MKNRKGFGLAQIMAMLLVVLPTFAFLMMFMLEYWSVMQIDNRLKLITNLTSTSLDGVEDLSDDGLGVYATSQEWSTLNQKLNTLCPQGTNIAYLGRVDESKGMVTVNLSYAFKGRYLDNVLQSSMSTYSYHDQNATINLECK